jgi:uncharacterized membrane protein YhaH (DUF805 family)
MYPLNQPLKTGVIIGIILVLYSALIYAFDINIYSVVLSMLNGLIILAAVVAAAYVGVKHMRDKDLNGEIKYLQALVGGFVVLLIAFYINNLFTFILNGYIDPEYLPAKMDQMITSFEGIMPEEAMDEMVDKMEKNLDPKNTFLKNLWMNPIFAVIISAIIALIVKKNTKDSKTTEA